MGVVGHEQGVLQHPLHHRVTALPYVDHAAGIHLRAAIAVVHRRRGERDQHVQPAHAGRGLLHLAHLAGGGLPQLAEELVFQSGDPGLRRQDLVLQVLELLGDEPFAVHQGLLADIILRHHAVIALGHLDIIAEHLVEAHLQALDAGALLFPPLQRGHHVRPMRQDIAQTVHLFVIAGADEVPLSDGEGQAVLLIVLPDGAVQGLLELFQAVQPLDDGSQGTACQLMGLLRQLRQYRQPVGQGQHVAGVGAAVHHLADQPLQVGDAPQGQGELFPGHAVPGQLLHRVLPPRDRGGRAQGLLQPGADEPVAHGRFGLVQHPQQRAALLLPPEGLGELQRAPGGEVQFHVFLAHLLVDGQRAEMAQVGLLRLRQVRRQRPRRL